MQQKTFPCSDQFEALQEELDRRRQECLQLKVFPRVSWSRLQLKEHPCSGRVGVSLLKRAILTRISTQAVLANVQLEGGAGPPSLLGEEPEAEELLQAYETQKKVNYRNSIGIYCLQFKASLLMKDSHWVQTRSSSLIGCLGLVASFNIGTRSDGLPPRSRKFIFIRQHLFNFIIQSCRLSSSCRLHYPEKGRRRHLWRRSSELRLRRWLNNFLIGFH